MNFLFHLGRVSSFPSLNSERLLLPLPAHIKQLLDEVEQNIVICQWRADQLFADAEGRGK